MPIKTIGSFKKEGGLATPAAPSSPVNPIEVVRTVVQDILPGDDFIEVTTDGPFKKIGLNADLLAQEFGVPPADDASFLLTSDPRPLPGASNTYTENTFTYDSSIDDAINGLGGKYSYDIGLAAQGTLPVLIIMHGYGGSVAEIQTTTMRRYASYGFLAVAAGKRGTRDASAREAQDILDALAAIRALLPSVAHGGSAAIVGYSGGGGNAMALAHKAPDTFTVFASFFGISDYGYDTVDGWWFTRQDVRSLLMTDIGDREAVTAPYRARDAVGSIAQTLGEGGYLYMFHDSADGDVSVANSRRVRDAMQEAGLKNFTYDESTPGSALRWLHGYPEAVAALINAEWRFVRRAREATVWTVPKRGKLRVAGWHRNKLFEIWLGPTSSPKTTSSGGKDEVADVEYDTLTATYKVTPLSGAMFVQIIQGDRDKTVEVISQTFVELELNGIIAPGDIARTSEISNSVLELEASGAGSGIVLAGSDVSQWTDFSGAAKHFTDGTNRPLFVANLDGFAAVQFDSSNSERLGGPVLFDPNANYTLCFAYKTTAVDGNPFSQANSGQLNKDWVAWRHATTNSIHHVIDDASGGTEAGANNSTVNAWHFFVLRRKDGFIKSRVDNNVETSLAAPAGTILGTNRSALGCLWDQPGQRNFSGGSFRAVAAWSRALSDAEVAAVRGLWQNKYSLP